MKLKRLAIVALVLIMMFASTACLRRNSGEGAVELTVYGLVESDVIDPLIAKYRQKKPSVRIKYKKFNDPGAFEDLIVNEIAEGEGPDIFFTHNTWFPRHLKKVTPLESENFTPQMFSEAFVSVAQEDFVQPDPKDGVLKIFAMPLYTDTLALYYNKDIFEQKFPQRGKPAPDWDTFVEESSSLRLEKDRKLEQGAISLGRSDNIKLAADILYHLFLQFGSSFYDSGLTQVNLGGEGDKAFDFFLNFSDRTQKSFSWNADMASPSDPSPELTAFLTGKTATMFGYASLYPNIETELKNAKARSGEPVVSKSSIAVAVSPQFSTEPSEQSVWANYYGLSVSRNSKHPLTAWDFIHFATSKNSADLFHDKTGLPTARRDLIENQKKEPIIDVFISQLGIAKSFPVFSKQKFDELLREAVASANSGQTPREALSNAVSKMNELLKTEAPDGLYPKPLKKKK